MNWADGLELIRPWLTTGFIGGILALIVKLYTDNRRLRLAERSRSEEFQLEISADGRSNLQFVIDNLVRDIKAQREATERSDEAHERCQVELAEIRENYASQGHKLDGVVRQFIHFQMSYAQGIPISDRTPFLSDLRRQFDELEAQERR